MTTFVDWTGLSGRTYRYWLVQAPFVASNIKAEPGNYMFVKPHPAGGLVPVYIGIAEDLSQRIPGHDRWNDVIAAGATHLYGHTNGDAVARAAEERDLIAGWQPALNTQHRGLAELLAGLGS